MTKLPSSFSEKEAVNKQQFLSASDEGQGDVKGLTDCFRGKRTAWGGRKGGRPVMKRWDWREKRGDKMKRLCKDKNIECW